jgi:hypothetical protein
VKVEIEVRIGDVLAILYIPHIPDTAIKRLPNLSKNICEGLKLATCVICTFIRHTTYEDEPETDEVLHGFEEGRTILEAFVGDEKIFTLLDVGHIPWFGAQVPMKCFELGGRGVPFQPAAGVHRGMWDASEVGVCVPFDRKVAT